MKFKAETKGLDKFEEKMLKIPNMIRPVIAATLNEQAWLTKSEHMPWALDKAFTIRDPRFMNRQLKFTKAKKNASPEAMFSEAGSVGARDFTGWEEQQTGKRAEKNRVASEAARTSQSFQKKMKRGARMTNTKAFRTPKDYMQSKRVHSKKQAIFFMLRETKASRLNFMIRKSDNVGGVLGNLEPGLYGWVGSKLMRLQKFGEKYDPKKVDWRGNALDRLVKKRGSFDREFERRLNRMIDKL